MIHHYLKKIILKTTNNSEIQWYCDNTAGKICFVDIMAPICHSFLISHLLILIPLKRDASFTDEQSAKALRHFSADTALTASAGEQR